MTDTQTRLADDPQMPTAGSVVGDRYEIRGVLGEGGFAVVYRAFDTRTKADVAVKVLDPIMSRRREFASRFMREVETVSRLRHHNTITIFDAGETDRGCLYLVMELLEGEPLDVVLEKSGALSHARVKHIASQILKSLQEAHTKGIIHRDLKPANVFLADVAGEADYVKVLDFGIAKSLDDSQDASLTATGQVMCSPHYVAPERVKEHVTVPASDLYSLGVMMIELLEGAPPYEAESPMMLAVKHLSAEPVPMGPATRSTPFAGVIEQAVEKSLDGRFDSALEMLRALEATPAVALATTAVPASGSTSPTSSFMGEVDDATIALDDVDDAATVRRRTPLLVAAVIALLLVGGVAWSLFAPADSTPDAATGDEVAAAPAPAPPTEAPTPATDSEPEAAPAPTDGPALALVTASAEVSGSLGLAVVLAERAQRTEAEDRAAEAARAEAAAEAAAAEAAAARRDRPSREERRRDERRAEATPTPAEPVAQPTPEPEAAPEPEPEPEDEPNRPRIRTDLAPR